MAIKLGDVNERTEWLACQAAAASVLTSLPANAQATLIAAAAMQTSDPVARVAVAVAMLADALYAEYRKRCV